MSKQTVNQFKKEIVYTLTTRYGFKPEDIYEIIKDRVKPRGKLGIVYYNDPKFKPGKPTKYLFYTKEMFIIAKQIKDILDKKYKTSHLIK